MALRYGIEWRKARGGIEDQIHLLRENGQIGSSEIDTVYYVQKATGKLRKNILRDDGERVRLEDIAVYCHPRIGAALKELKSFPILLISSNLLSYSFLPGDLFKETIHLSFFCASFFTASFCMISMASVSQNSVEAWNRYMNEEYILNLEKLDKRN